ncbi:MAG: dihydrofolate reductase [Actinobacteria bacterium]|nr:MAG: dihydrofolate reductase [Actinomycetota bacterium]
MGKLVVSEFITLDGVIDDPGGAEEFDRGGWAFQFERGAEGDKFKLDETLGAEALLLGRVTYEGFAAAWPSRTDEVGFADKMNTMPKYVVSSTLQDLTWDNSTRIDGDVAEEVAKLKEQVAGEILVAGSATLVRTLIETDLVDELRLMVFPTVLGGGKRLFGDSASAKAFRLIESRAVGDAGVVILRYEPART